MSTRSPGWKATRRACRAARARRTWAGCRPSAGTRPRWRAHHHHHRFDTTPIGPGAEVEASRGCPYHCTFCAKDNFREGYRKRPLEVLLGELDGLVAQGVRYVYFIDELFLPDRPLLEALVDRPVSFGVQMRVDNWSREMLDLLGRAGCVSIEAGVESITREGRSLLAKRCKLSTEQLGDLLIHAKKSVPFVQANLIQSATDDPADVAAFRERLRQHGVWANEPVPMFPLPGLARVHDALGHPRRRGVGALGRALPRSVRSLQRPPGRSWRRRSPGAPLSWATSPACARSGRTRPSTWIPATRRPSGARSGRSSTRPARGARWPRARAPAPSASRRGGWPGATCTSTASSSVAGLAKKSARRRAGRPRGSSGAEPPGSRPRSP